MGNKLKTRKSVKKRFKITKSGKVLRRQSHNRHLKASKSRKKTRQKKKFREVTGPMAKKIKRVLGAK